MRLLVLIANKGAILLESGETIARITVPAGPTRLLVPPNQHASDIQALYGASDGSIGLITYNRYIVYTIIQQYIRLHFYFLTKNYVIIVFSFKRG